MVQVKLKGQVSLEDVEALERAYRDIARITVGLHPAAPPSTHLDSILWTMRAVIHQWRGKNFDHPIDGRG